MKGTVKAVYSKPWGTVILHSFKLEDDDTFYRCGQNKPDIKEGALVEFDVDSKSNASNIVTLGTSTSMPESSPTTPEPRGNVGGRIRYQAARADATRLVVAALHTDHLPHAANTAKGKRLDLLTGYVEQITKTLLEQEEQHEA